MFETTSISGLIELGLGGCQGTWQFISARLLITPDLLHELADDRESAFWVLLWVVLRYTKHNLSPAKLAKRLKMFDEADWECGKWSGGDEKAHVLRQARPFENIQFAERPALPELLRDLVRILSVRYKEKPSLDNEGIQDPAQVAILDARHNDALAALDSTDWLIKTLRNAASKDGWPINDESSRQIIGDTGPGFRRKYRDEDTAQPSSKKHKT
jgi:hypothetical protein